MPSVRGRQKLLVSILFVLSGTLSSALVGYLLSIPFLVLPSPGLGVVVAVVGLGVLLDLLRLVSGRPHPPTSGRQVPQEWSRLLDPEVVAVLYGARLGVGPLTILSTWTWWSVTIAGALIGPGTAAIVGATFGSVRLASTIVASAAASRSDDPAAHIAWFGKLRTRQRPNWAALNGAGLFLVVAVMLAGCGANDRAAAKSTGQTTSLSQTTSVPVASTATTAAATWAASSTTDVPELTPPTVPVRLEDVVRTATTTQLATIQTTTQLSTASVEPAVFSTAPDALAAALPAQLAGFEMIDAPEADRFLDLAAASAIQPDPTEEVALLETRGFSGGWTRAFRNETNDVAVVSVYHFEDAAEAEFYLEDGLITIGGYGGKFFDIPSLPGVRGFVQYFTGAEQNEELVSLGAAFQFGPRWHLVYLVGSVETVTSDLLIPAVTALTESAKV